MTNERLLPDQIENLAEICNARERTDIPASLIVAIALVESGGNPWAARYEPTYQVHSSKPRPSGCSQGTEIACRRTSWGIMQILGDTARNLGFEGWLPELCDPEISITLALRYLQRQHKRYQGSWRDIIAAYNAGSARTDETGAFLNQHYVDLVCKEWEAREGYKPYL